MVAEGEKRKLKERWGPLRQRKRKPVCQHRNSGNLGSPNLNASTRSLPLPQAEVPHPQVHPVVQVVDLEGPIPVKQCPTSPSQALRPPCIYPQYVHDTSVWYLGSESARDGICRRFGVHDVCFKLR